MLLFPNRLLPTQCFRKLNEVVLCVFACQLEQPGQQDVGGVKPLQVEQTAPLWIQCVSCWHWAQLDWLRPQCGHGPGAGGLAWGRSPLCPVVQAPWREPVSASELKSANPCSAGHARARSQKRPRCEVMANFRSSVPCFFSFFLHSRLKFCIFNVTYVSFSF